MYTFEERTKAVKRYIQSGYSEGAHPIRTPGYPSHTALRNWYRERLSMGSLRTGSASTPLLYTDAKACSGERFAANCTTRIETGLTEFALPAGRVYLSPVIACSDGMVYIVGRLERARVHSR